jgi:hypothetical protein
VAAGALLARAIEQPLANLFPDRLRTVKPDRVDRLDFDGPLAAAARNPNHMALDLGQPPLTGWGGPLEAARGSRRTDGEISTSAYAPPFGNRFERDRFALLRIAEEILDGAGLDDEDASRSPSPSRPAGTRCRNSRRFSP